MGRDMDQLGCGAEDGAFIMGNSGGKAVPIGSDQAVDGLLGVQAATGKLYWASAASGDTGIQGNTGVQGRTGVQGQTGIIGSTGVQGATGIQGSTADPWIVLATTGTPTVDTTGYVWAIVQGVTGVFPFYSKA